MGIAQQKKPAVIHMVYIDVPDASQRFGVLMTWEIANITLRSCKIVHSDYEMICSDN